MYSTDYEGIPQKDGKLRTLWYLRAVAEALNQEMQRDSQ